MQGMFFGAGMLIHAVADHILSKRKPAGSPILRPLALEKLVYYAQGWHLALRDEPLFDEDIQAWRHGPVAPTLYRRFRFLGGNPIKADRLITNPKSLLSPSSLEVIDQVWGWYGKFTGPELIDMTHEERPWKETWGTRPRDGEGQDVIDPRIIREFFKEKHSEALENSFCGAPSKKSLKLLGEIVRV
jgi:uncharacterized phage-associated protein